MSVFSLTPQLVYADARGYMPAFTAAARQTGVDRNLLLAVASRESNMGMTLANGLGDNGYGIGIMQIDRRAHPQFAATHGGFDARDNVLKGAQILRHNLQTYGGNKLLALDAYNAGTGGVSRALDFGVHPDSYTTGGDYGTDVLNRYHTLKKMSGGTHMAGPKSTERPETRAMKLAWITGGGLLTSIFAAVYIIESSNNSKSKITKYEQ